MPEGSHLLYGAPVRREGRRSNLGAEASAWPSAYWFENYKGYADLPHLIALYSGTENWIIRYHRLIADVIDGRMESRTEPDEHLLRFQIPPREKIRAILFEEDGHVELEDSSHVWVAPGSPWEALDCAHRAWDEFEPAHGGAWRTDGAMWSFSPDQDLIYWSADGLNHDRLAVRAVRDPASVPG